MNRPKLPASVRRSTQVGVKYPQLDGRKSWASDVTTITKRSNHMPRFTSRHATNMIGTLWRALRNQKTCGTSTLHDTMIQYAQAYCPNARLRNANDSYIDPLYQAMKNSMV